MALRQKSTDMGMHTEQLAGRTQQRFFLPEEEERFTYPEAFEVDFNKRAEFDAARWTRRADQPEAPRADEPGLRHHRDEEPRRQAFAAVGILNRLNLHIEGSLGYFGCGLIDGPNIRIKGRVGWSCAENMMAGHGRHREERRLDLRRGAARRRSRLHGRCRRARGHRHEGRHDPRSAAGPAPSAAS